MRLASNALSAWLVVSAFLVGGCVGVMVVHSKTESFERFGIVEKGTINRNAKTPNPTLDEVRKSWGEPDAIRDEKNGVVVWRFNTGVRFTGAVPVVGVPVPLVVPSGHDYVEIHFSQGVAVKAVVSYTSSSAAYVDEDGKPKVAK